MHNKYENIIWDWNGTLLNDISICIQSMNILLKERGLPLLTEDKYREVFTFPVRDYYEHIGFNFSEEDFDIPALKFINNYHKFLPLSNLFYEAKSVLRQFQNSNTKQFILSAMEHSSLLLSVQNLGIENYFTVIAGIADHFAKSKVDRGIQLIAHLSLNRKKTLMVGDTLHDLEVAAA